MRKVVVYSGTSKVYPEMVTACKSLIANTDVDRIIFVAEQDRKKFPIPIPDYIEVVNVANQTYFPITSPNRSTRLTYMVLMRCAYYQMFPEEDAVLQLDIDTIVNQDISDLWDVNLDDYYLAAVREPASGKGGNMDKHISDIYFNMGVALMNLKKFRDGKGDRIMRQLNGIKYKAAEQDCINEWCKGQILEIPSDFNASREWTAPTDNPKIIHYAGVRHWQDEELWKYYESLSWEDVERLREERRSK